MSYIIDYPGDRPSVTTDRFLDAVEIIMKEWPDTYRGDPIMESEFAVAYYPFFPSWEFDITQYPEDVIATISEQK